MPPAINPLPFLRTVTFRPRPAVIGRGNVPVVVRVPRRAFADRSNDLPTAESEAEGRNMRQAEHVSEEAVKMARIRGGQGPDIEGQGTAVREILEEEEETRRLAPQVLQEELEARKHVSQVQKEEEETRKKGDLETRKKDDIETRKTDDLEMRKTDDIETRKHAPQAPKDKATAGIPTKFPTRQFSTYTQHRLEVESSSAPSEIDLSLEAFNTFSAADTERKGHKFPLPSLPLPRELVKDYRYDPVVDQVTNLLMKDGKKSVAQRNMSVLLNILRTAPAPTYNPERPLLPGAPPASHLPLNPTLYLTLAVDSVAPLLRIRSQRGAAGGGMALQIPVPLGLKQRRRTAFMWILDAAVKRKSRGSGNDMFAQKVAEEMIAIVEGKSAVWEKRMAVHRLATTARANLNYSARGRK